MTVNNDIDDDSATKHGDSHTLNLSQPRPHAAENISSSPPIAVGNLLARASTLENAWHADSKRLTAEGNFQQFSSHQTMKAVKCRSRRNLEDRCIPSDKTFRKQRWIAQHCEEVDRPTSVEGGPLLQRIRPGSKIGPIEEILIFHIEGSSGRDVKVPSTSNPEILTWVRAQKKFKIVVSSWQPILSL